MPVLTTIQHRRDTAANWTSTNPTLAAGEMGFETDTGLFKIGTGSTTWTSLSYSGLPSQSGNSGKYLTTNGSAASWATLNALPTQTGYSGYLLTTNGTTASWSQTVTALTINNGTNLSTGVFNITNPGGGNPNFIMSGAGEQTFRFYNTNATGTTRVSWKLASRLNTDWNWIMYTDSAGNGTNDLNFGNLVVNPAVSIDANGNFTAAGDITTNSDIRLKKDVLPLENALETLTKLKGISYNYIDRETDHRHIGLVAQDVEEVLPEAVSEDSKGMKSVAYGNLVGLLVEAIKELQAEVIELRGKIDGI
jgi:hypothetical protein